MLLALRVNDTVCVTRFSLNNNKYNIKIIVIIIRRIGIITII